MPDKDDGRRSHGSNGRREEVGPLLLDGAADQRDQRADPTRALPSAEIDLPGGGAWATEVGGLGLEPSLVISCRKVGCV